MIQWTLFWNPSMWRKNHTRNREESCHYRRANGRDVKEGRLEVDAWCVRHSQTCCPVLFDDWPVEFLEHGHPHLRYCSTYYIGQNCAFLLSTAWVCYLILFEKQPFEFLEHAYLHLRYCSTCCVGQKCAFLLCTAWVWCTMLFEVRPVEFLEHGHPCLRYCSTYCIGQKCAFLLSTAWVCYTMLFEEWLVKFLEHGHPRLRYCSTYGTGQKHAFLLCTAWVCYTMLFEDWPVRYCSTYGIGQKCSFLLCTAWAGGYPFYWIPNRRNIIPVTDWPVICRQGPWSCLSQVWGFSWWMPGPALVQSDDVTCQIWCEWVFSSQIM